MNNLTDKQLKLIYEYMGWAWGYDLKNNILMHKRLDSNTAWECVQEMERRG